MTVRLMFENPRRFPDSRACRALKFSCSVLMLVAAIRVHAAEHEAAPPAAPAAALGAQLTSARGETLGAITGRTSSFDAEANMVGAYGVVSAQGYFADVLPSGALGQVLSLIYASSDCSGAPAIEQSSVLGGPLPVPGYVFAFDTPVRVFNVPLGATLRELVSGSVRQRTRTGFSCEAQQRRTRVYPLQVNRSETSGFAEQYAGPLRVQMVASSAHDQRPDGTSAARSQQPRVRETGAGADLPFDTPQCAPGCFMPYLGDHVCEAECANSLCGFDAGDCSAAYVERAKQHEATLCAPSCEATSIGDGFCDTACNVSSCNFDQGDCK
jgi:hypothetical protein